MQALDTRTARATDARPVGEAALRTARARRDARRADTLDARRSTLDAGDRDAVITEGMRRMTAHAVRYAYRIAESVARAYDVDDATLSARTLDAFAVWVGRLDADTARDILGVDNADTARYRGTVLRIARRHASRMGSGRGTMPRLSHSAHSPLCGTDAVRGTRSLSCVASCPVREIDDAALRATVTRRACVDSVCVLIGWHGAECDGVPFGTLALTARERDTLRSTFHYERTERAPAYARFLDAFGDTTPDAGTPHPSGHRAPFVPERDAPSVRRETFRETVRRVCDSDTADTVLAALDATHGTTRGTFRVDWDTVRETLGTTAHRSTLQRRTRAGVDAVRRARAFDTVTLERAGVDARRSTHYGMPGALPRGVWSMLDSLARSTHVGAYGTLDTLDTLDAALRRTLDAVTLPGVYGWRTLDTDGDTALGAPVWNGDDGVTHGAR